MRLFQLRYLPSFSLYNIFHFSNSKSFQTGCQCLASFSPLVASSPKQAAIVFTPALLFPPIFYPLPRGPIFLEPIPPLLLYIKHHFPLNKQFSIDSFLDWEGLHWDFSSMIMSPPISVPFSAYDFRRRSIVFILANTLNLIVGKFELKILRMKRDYFDI